MIISPPGQESVLTSFFSCLLSYNYCLNAVWLDSANTSIQVRLFALWQFCCVKSVLHLSCFFGSSKDQDQRARGAASHSWGWNEHITQSVLLCRTVRIFLSMLMASRLKVKIARLWLLVPSFLPATLNGAPWLNHLTMVKTLLCFLGKVWAPRKSPKSDLHVHLQPRLTITSLPTTCKTFTHPHLRSSFDSLSFWMLLSPASIFSA